MVVRKCGGKCTRGFPRVLITNMKSEIASENYLTDKPPKSIVYWACSACLQETQFFTFLRGVHTSKHDLNMVGWILLVETRPMVPCTPHLAQYKLSSSKFNPLLDNGTTPAPKLLVFSSSRGLLVGVHQARNLLGEGTAVGRTQFSAALQRASGFRGSAQVSATPAQLKALKQHASYPATSSKANLAFATHVEKALSSLDLLPPSLEHSFHQLYSQQANPPPPPPVEEDPQPPPPAVAAQAPLHNDIYYGRVS